MRKLIFLLALLAALVFATPVEAQVRGEGHVNTQSGGSCVESGSSTSPTCVSFNIGNVNALSLQVKGTFSGTLTFEITADGVNYVSVLLVNATSGTTATTASAPGIFTYTNGGGLRIRARATSWASGTAVVSATVGQEGGGAGGGGGGSSFDGVLLDAPAGDSLTDTANNALRVNVVAGGGAGGTSSSFGAANPATGTAAGFSDGTNMQLARVFDGDTGAGTQYLLGAIPRIPASGGTIGYTFASGVIDAGTQRVVLATDQPAIPTVTTLTTLTGGGIAAGAADSGNPLKVGGKFNTTQPTLDNGDRGDLELDSRGRLRVAIGACETCTATETTVTEDAAYTTQQTGAAVWTPAGGLKIYVAAVQIQCGGTTAGTIRLWFGASGDTTYTAGTDQQLAFVNCGTPSATVAPGMVWSFPIPVAASTADYILRATTSAGITVDVVVHGYER